MILKSCDWNLLLAVNSVTDGQYEHQPAKPRYNTRNIKALFDKYKGRPFLLGDVFRLLIYLHRPSKEGSYHRQWHNAIV